MEGGINLESYSQGFSLKIGGDQICQQVHCISNRMATLFKSSDSIGSDAIVIGMSKIGFSVIQPDDEFNMNKTQFVQMPTQFFRNDKHTLSKILVAPTLELTFFEKTLGGELQIFEQRPHRANQTAFNMTQMTSMYQNLWNNILSKESEEKRQQPSLHLRSEEITLLESPIVVIPKQIDPTWNQTQEPTLTIHKRGTQLPYSVASSVLLLIQNIYDGVTVNKAREESFEFGALSACL